MKAIGYEFLEVLFLLVAAIAMTLGDLPRATLSLVLAVYFQLLQRPRA